MRRLGLPHMLRALVACVFLGVVLVPLPASAGCEIGGGGSQVDLGCEDGGGTGGPGNDDPVYTVPGPWTDYYYVPACDANGPPGQSADVLCMAAISTCPKDGDIRFYVYTREMGADNQPTGDWEQKGTQCRGADDPSEGGPAVITTFMIRDAAQAAAPKAVVRSEPATKSYVNLPTNFYTDDDAVTVDVTVLGISIPITFTPTGATWSFGDGGSGSGSGVKAAAVGAPGAVEHEYAKRGDYEVTVSRTFSAAATLPGGQTLTLDAPVTSTSAPYELEIGEVQSIVTGIR